MRTVTTLDNGAHEFCGQDSGVVVPEYVTPEVVEVGDLVELTTGSRSNDTGDMKRYYN